MPWNGKLLYGFGILLNSGYRLGSDFIFTMLVKPIVCCFILPLIHHLNNLLGKKVDPRLALNLLELLLLGCHLQFLRIDALVFQISILILQKLLKISWFALFIFGCVGLRSKCTILNLFIMLFV
jgi:hypothetical protein